MINLGSCLASKYMHHLNKKPHLANKVRYTDDYSRLVSNGVALTTFFIGSICMGLLDKYAFALLRDIDAAGGRENAAALEVVEFLAR